MKTVEMKYGNGTINVSIDEKNIIGVIEGSFIRNKKSEDDIILDALKKPINSPRLKELVNLNDTVCIVIPDITRAWQKTDKFLYRIVQELNLGGVKNEDIMIISAVGSHRSQTREEHEKLLGKSLSKKIKVVDHDCYDNSNLLYLGETTYKTPIYINKKALECDHIVLVGGIVYHFLAGLGGGRKTVLPGIASYKTIMKNHALSLSETLGEGKNKDACTGKLEGNPVHEDMIEAAAFVKPTFIFNVIIGSNNGNIVHAVAGNYITAHLEGCKKVEELDSVKIKEKADLVIGTAGGYPKDINFYQTIKTILNTREATKEGGTIIIISECSEGLGGNEDVKNMLLNYDNLLDREKELRREYSISKDVAYIFCETAQKYHVIFVTNLDPKLLEKANITAVKTIEEALDITYKKKGKNLKTYIMTHAANTFPKLIK